MLLCVQRSSVCRDDSTSLLTQTTEGKYPLVCQKTQAFDWFMKIFSWIFRSRMYLRLRALIHCSYAQLVHVVLHGFVFFFATTTDAEESRTPLSSLTVFCHSYPCDACSVWFWRQLQNLSESAILRNRVRDRNRFMTNGFYRDIFYVYARMCLWGAALSLVSRWRIPC